MNLGCLQALLCYIDTTFNSRNLKIYYGAEPVDIIIHDETENVVLLAEVKAAPLTTLPLAVKVEVQTEVGDNGELVSRPHSATDNSFLTSSNVNIVLPKLEGDRWNYEFVPLGMKGSSSSIKWAYEQISKVFGEDDQLFYRYFQFWSIAYSAYTADFNGREVQKLPPSVPPMPWGDERGVYSI